MSNDNAHQASKAEVDAFLARLSAKSRTAIDRYLAACDETNAAHAAVWRRLATDMKPPRLDSIAREITMDALPGAFSTLLGGAARGRFVVNVGP